jgi:hypothetical protein
MLISSLQSRSVFGDRICRSGMEPREVHVEEGKPSRCRFTMIMIGYKVPSSRTLGGVHDNGQVFYSGKAWLQQSAGET